MFAKAFAPSGPNLLLLIISFVSFVFCNASAKAIAPSP